ncbi:MAG: HAMP domain-containing protein [Acidobacteria bacterium]|nr:HAMP domain-containing protein [Acidobacteriota bacterium]
MRRTRRSLWPFRSLRGKLLFLICLATLPAVLFTAYAAENEREAALARTESDALHLAGLTSREHAHQIRGARELLAWLGTRLAREGPQSRIIGDPDFLPALLAGHPQLANIGVLSPEGTVIRSAYPLASRRSWRDNPAFAAALQSTSVEAGTYTISPILDRPTLNHAYAVRDGDGHVTSVAFTGLDLDWLSAVARESGPRDGGSVMITDRAGRVLAYGGDEIGGGARALDVQGAADIAQSGHGRIVPIGGEHRFVVAAPLDGAPGLFVAVALPYEQVLQDANAAFYRTLVGLGVLTLVTIVAAFAAAEVGFLRALRSLARTAQLFGAGDLTARAVVPRGHNESALLAGAFNTMADSLARRHQEALDAQAALRGLTGALQDAREAEAARISRELHDQIGQLLTSMKFDLVGLTASCPVDERDRPCATKLRDGVAAMNEQIATALEFVRRISSELRPGVLDKLGLIPALEWQAREVESRTDLIVQIEADGVPANLDETIAVTLFRIAQEALTNVVRHAHARVADVRLCAIPGGLRLEVHDDGIGADAGALQSPTSLGIIGMRERARLVSGVLAIQSAPGQGTTLTVTVPVPSMARADAHPAGG